MLRWLKRLLHVVLELVIGCFFAILLAWQVLAIGVIYGLGTCLQLCGCGLLAFLALIAIHELGHLLGAWAMGLRFERFTVGPLQVLRERKRIRVRLNFAWFQPAAYVVPAFSSEVHGRWHWAAMVLGGPLSNLLVAVACLAAASRLNPGPPPQMPYVARAGWRSMALLYPGNPATAWLNVAGIMSLGLGMVTLVPGFSGSLRTDGGQLLDLWRGKRIAEGS